MMSSPPLTPAHSAPATTASRRLSLNVTGPRPLHLVHGNVSLPSVGPTTAPLAPSFRSAASQFPSPPSSSKGAGAFGRPNPRRHSSISYRPNTNDIDLSARSPLRIVRPGLTRSFSTGPKSSSPITSPGDRRSAGFELNTTQERPPLTLAEKHAELLHFIAQKESKCLELRSQLASQEAELLQLKRKWERIVNRGFSEDTSLTTNGQSSGVVLEGIREGVQGVSRFIAAGLAIGELSPASSPSSSRPLISASRPFRPTHSNSQSSSSISTYATKSTRFSQSSASSIGEEPPSLHKKAEEEDSTQILMVHDTGATPTVSPNPAFEHQRQQREVRADPSSQSQTTRLTFETEKDTFLTSSKMHRRRSRDCDSLEDNLMSEESVFSSRSASPSKAMETDKLEAARLKRASINGTAFPPVSSIPGLASLTVGAASPPVSSWVGNVGKKWEELQRGSTFSKSQKRASTLFSDVSQSIASALSSPPPTSTLKSRVPAPPSYFSPPPTSLLLASTNSTSLLDDDDFIMPTSSIMTPDLKPTLKARPRPNAGLILQPKPTSASMSTQASATATLNSRDDEDEWNW